MTTRGTLALHSAWLATVAVIVTFSLAFASVRCGGDGGDGGDGGVIEPPRPRPAGTLRLTVFELPAHGLAVAIETPSGALHFVDTGPKSDDGHAAKELLAPFVRARASPAIASIVISHPHRDHFEGARHLLKQFEVGAFVDAGMQGALVAGDYVDLKKTAGNRGAVLREVRAGDVLDWDPALEVSILAPPRAGVISTEKNFLNDHSIVLRIQHGKNVFLLPGDIERAGSESLLAAVPADRLRATVLIAPHHGFFEERAFAGAVKPQHVVVSCQAEYDDKEPRSPGDLARSLFEPVGAAVWVTAWHGAVTITSDGEVCAVTTARVRR